MANVVDMQITEEGPRNAVVKFTGVLDTSDVNLVSALELSDMRNNDTRMNLVGFRVNFVEFAIGVGLELQIAWNGTQPQQLYPLAGRGRIGSVNYGGFLPDRTRAGYDGSINITTTGYAFNADRQPIQNFTVVLELVKLYTV